MQQLNPLGRKSTREALEFIRNPRKMCEEIHGYVHMLYETIRRHKLGLERSIRAYNASPLPHALIIYSIALSKRVMGVSGTSLGQTVA